MTILINGKTQEISGNIDLLQLIENLGFDLTKPGVAVAVNCEVIPRKMWSETCINPDSEIEIIHAVQGG
ncbi:TPA: sulfur carrier protein ThiS [Candidatus Poribacteria bacterium]|nr:sulfur carrier protein ThiS [Candidatus Poribacteria bacterium]